MIKKKHFCILNPANERKVNMAKIDELLELMKKKEEKKNCVIWILAIVGAVVMIAAIAYAVYRYLTPDYLDDFEDDFDDDFEDDDLEEEASEETKEETKEENEAEKEEAPAGETEKAE